MDNDPLKPLPPALSRSPRKLHRWKNNGKDTGSVSVDCSDLSMENIYVKKSNTIGLIAGDVLQAYIKKYGEFIHKPDWGLYLISTIRAPTLTISYQEPPDIPMELYSTFPCHFRMISENLCNTNGILIIPVSLDSSFAKEIFNYPYRTHLFIYFWHYGKKFSIFPSLQDIDASSDLLFDDILSWLKINKPDIFDLRRRHIIDRIRKSNKKGLYF